MMKGDYHIEVMRKIQESSKDCGVRLRTKEESDRVIQERLLQLELDGQTETKEYRFLSAISKRTEQGYVPHS